MRILRSIFTRPSIVCERADCIHGRTDPSLARPRAPVRFRCQCAQVNLSLGPRLAVISTVGTGVCFVVCESYRSRFEGDVLTGAQRIER